MGAQIRVLERQLNIERDARKAAESRLDRVLSVLIAGAEPMSSENETAPMPEPEPTSGGYNRASVATDMAFLLSGVGLIVAMWVLTK
jgi:hypothetical protein